MSDEKAERSLAARRLNDDPIFNEALARLEADAVDEIAGYAENLAPPCNPAPLIEKLKAVRALKSQIVSMILSEPKQPRAVA